MAYLKMFEEFPEAPLNLPGARATSASFKTRAGNSILVGLHLIGRILINDCFYCLISVNDMKTRPWTFHKMYWKKMLSSLLYFKVYTVFFEWIL